MKKKLQMTPQKQRIIQVYHEKLHANKMGNPEKMKKFLEMWNFPRLNQEEIQNMNKQITSNKTESVESSHCGPVVNKSD